MLDDADCPALTTLASGQLTRSEERHVRSCRRCRLVLGDDRPEVVDDDEAGLPEAPVAARPGDVVQVVLAGADLYLLAVVLHDLGHALDVVPISADVVYAGPSDLLLDPSVLGYAAMAETGNVGVVLADQVEAVVAASMDDGSWSQLVELCDATAIGKPPAPHLPTGPPIWTDEDPRVAFAHREHELARPYYALASAFSGVVSLAQLVERRIEAMERPIGAVAVELGVDGVPAPWVERVYDGTADLLSEVAPLELAELLRTLSVPGVVPTRELIVEAAEGWPFEAPPIDAQPPELAGAMLFQGAELDPGRADAANRYAETVLQALGR